jgi:hypothetical protein
LSFTSVSTLQDLHSLLRYSFPQYMAFARPHAPKGRREALAVFNDIATDQTEQADRASQLLDELHVAPDSPGFPMEFTDAHDLSIDYLLRLAAKHQVAEVSELRELAQRPGLSHSVRTLAEECVGMSRAHLELLQAELQPLAS